MQRLVAYLIENLILDFQGELTLEMARDFLREDNGPESRALLAKLVADRGVSDMLIVLADCLQEKLGEGISPESVRQQVRLYADS